MGLTDHEVVAGYILNKLYMGRFWAKPGGQPHRHTSISNIPKGYPPEYAGLVLKQLQDLKRKGLVVLFKHSGDGEMHAAALLDPEAVSRGLALINAYRAEVKLPPLDERLR